MQKGYHKPLTYSAIWKIVTVTMCVKSGLQELSFNEICVFFLQ